MKRFMSHLDTMYEVFLDIEQFVVFRYQPTNSGSYTMESFGSFDTYVKVFQLVEIDDNSITWEDLFQIGNKKMILVRVGTLN